MLLFFFRNENENSDAVKKWEDHHRMMRGRDGREVKERKSNDDARLLLRGRVVLLLVGGRKRSASRFF